MHLDELLGDAEPESGAAEFVSDGRVGLPELRKYIFQLILRNPGSGIRNTIDEHLSLALDPDLDPSLSGEFQCIPRQVHEALREALSVAKGHWHVRLRAGDEFQ